MAEWEAAGVATLRNGLSAAMTGLARLPAPKVREAWASRVLRSYCDHCAVVTLLATAHTVPRAQPRSDAGQGGDADAAAVAGGLGVHAADEDGEGIYGAEAWALLFEWYAAAEEGSAVRALIISLAPPLLFTWWSLASLAEPPLALADLEALLLGVYHEHQRTRDGCPTGMLLDVPSRHLVDAFVTASSPAAAAVGARTPEQGKAAASTLSQSALERHTAASDPTYPANDNDKHEHAGDAGFIYTGARTPDRVRHDGEPCPVAAFWLDSFQQLLPRMPLSARVLFIDLCAITIASGYRTVLLKRQRVRADTRSRRAAAALALAGRGKGGDQGGPGGGGGGGRRAAPAGGKIAGKAAAAARAAADKASALSDVNTGGVGGRTRACTDGEATVEGTGATEGLQQGLREVQGWGADWSALGRGGGGGGGSGAEIWADGRGASGAYMGGLRQLCPLATLELCNFGTPLGPDPSPPSEPGAHAVSLERDSRQRPPGGGWAADGGGSGAGAGGEVGEPGLVGRRVKLATPLLMRMSAVLRLMIGHTRLHELVSAAGAGGSWGEEERADEGRDGECGRGPAAGLEGGRGGGWRAGAGDWAGVDGSCGWQLLCIAEEVRSVGEEGRKGGREEGWKREEGRGGWGRGVRERVGCCLTCASLSYPTLSSSLFPRPSLPSSPFSLTSC